MPLLASPLSVSVAAALRERIVLNNLKAGERINEGELADDMGVSRTPLREALKILEHEGLVRSEPHRGTYVTHITAEDTAAMFQALALIESGCGKIAARWITDRELRDFKTLHERLFVLHQGRHREGYFAVNDEIHRRFVSLTGNQRLLEIHEQLIVGARRIRFAALLAEERWDESVAEHKAILAAITARDAAKVAALIEDHVRETGDFICRGLQALDDAPPPAHPPMD